MRPLRSLRGSLAAACACAAALLVTLPAIAAPDPQATARTRGEEGLSLFKAGQWDAAYAAFAEADTLYHAPTLVLYMARCRASQGRLLEAASIFDKAAAEPVPPNAPEAFKKAVATAHSEGEALRARIPRLSATVVGKGAASAQVKLDGAPVDAAALGADKRLDPGEHLITAETDGAAGVAKVTLKEGETARIQIALQPGMRIGAGGALEPAAAGAPEAPRKGSLVPAFAAFGVGGAGIVAGAITGALALGKVGSAHDGCMQSADGVWHCPPSSKTASENAVSSLHGLSAGSAAAFAIGGAAVATGVVLAIIRPGGSKAPEKAAVQLDVSPTWLGLRGRF